MIIALLGALCSGKATVAFYLQKEFGFVITNLFEIFAKELDIEFTDEVYSLFFHSKSLTYYLFISCDSGWIDSPIDVM